MSRWLPSSHLLCAVVLCSCVLASADPAPAQETAGGPQPASGWHTSFEEGLRYEGSGGFPKLHFGGLIAADYVLYDDRNQRDSDPRVDRALFRMDGEFTSEISFHVDVDLHGTDTKGGFDQAWVSYEPCSAFRLTAGLIKVPLTVEYSIPEEDLPFIGYAFPAFLTGRTDLGLRVDGEFGKGLFSYDLVFAGGAGFDLLGQRRGDPQLSVRLMSYPFRGSESFTRGIFVHAAYAFSPDYDGHLDVTTPLRSKIFNVPRLDADAAQHLAFAAGIEVGPVRLFHEFTRGSLIDLETAAGEQSLRNQIMSWQANLSIMLTGEEYDTRSFHTRSRSRLPARPMFNGGDDDGGFGAVELALRYSNADIDREFFALGFTDFLSSSQEFRTFTGAINWYLTRNLRLTAEVTRTLADDNPLEFGNQGRDTSYAFRVQWRF